MARTLAEKVESARRGRTRPHRWCGPDDQRWRPRALRFSAQKVLKVVDGNRGIDVGQKVKVQLVNTDVDRGFIDFARVG